MSQKTVIALLFFSKRDLFVKTIVLGKACISSIKHYICTTSTAIASSSLQSLSNLMVVLKEKYAVYVRILLVCMIKLTAQTVKMQLRNYIRSGSIKHRAKSVYHVKLRANSDFHSWWTTVCLTYTNDFAHGQVCWHFLGYFF